MIKTSVEERRKVVRTIARVLLLLLCLKFVDICASNFFSQMAIRYGNDVIVVVESGQRLLAVSPLDAASE